MGNNIETVYINGDQIIDLYFKKIIRRTDVLGNILHEYVDEFMGLDRKEIIEHIAKVPTERMALDFGLISDGYDSGGKRTDTLFRVSLPDSDGGIAVYVNVEGQNRFYLPYPLENRAEAYVAELIVSQGGKEYLRSDYKNIRKVYSIWLVFNPPEWLKGSVIRYDREPKVLFGSVRGPIPKMDLTHVTMVNMGDYDDNLPDPLALITLLFSNDKRISDRFGTLDDRFNIVFGNEEREEADRMLSLYESFEEGRLNYGEHCRSEGKAEGKAEGFADGKIEGKIEGIAATIVNLVSSGMSIDDAMKAVDEPDDVKERIRSMAESALSGDSP